MTFSRNYSFLFSNWSQLFLNSSDKIISKIEDVCSIYDHFQYNFFRKKIVSQENILK